MAKFLILMFKNYPEKDYFIEEPNNIFKSNIETKEVFIKNEEFQCIVKAYKDEVDKNFLDDEFFTIVIDGDPFFENKVITAKMISREILLSNFEKYFSQLDGAFSIFIFNKKQKEYFFIRDALGIKNLYYFQIKNVNSYIYAFSSASGALLNCSIIKKEYDIDSVARYASCNYRSVYRTNNSFFKEIHQLDPSNYIKVSEGNLSINNYINLFENSNFFENKNIDDISILFREEFKRSLKDNFSRNNNKKMILALSGGIDSGLIAAASNHDLGFKLPSISITYSDITNYDERILINQSISDNISTSNFLEISANNLIDDLPNLYKRFDTPIGTISVYIYDLLLRHSIQKGYNYILNGGSGDALFAGNYPAFMYNLADLYVSDKSLFYKETDMWIKNFGTEAFPKSRDMLIDFIVKSVDIKNKGKLFPKLLSLGDNLLNSDFKAYVSDLRSNIYDCSNSYLRSYILNEYYQEVIPFLSTTENQSDWFNGTCFTSPYLDKRLIKFCWQVPSYMKISNGINKVFPRISYKNEIPENIVNLIQKVGFNAPFDVWVRGPLKDYVFDILHSRKFLNRGIYNNKILNTYLEKHIRKESNNQMLIWQALNLELWMNCWID